jgi:outer membrane scaffolding protein for murein synthesis (MipA/OmpV family)
MIYQVSKNIGYSPNSEYRSFFEQYGNAGKNKHGYSIGSNFAIKSKKLELSVGIELLKLTNSLNNSDIPKSFDKIDSSVISVSIKPNGIFYTYKVDTTTLGINYNPNETTLTNSYVYVGFPVSLSYKVIQTSRIEIGLSLGVIYSRLISSKGFDANLSNGSQLFKNKNGESVSPEIVSLTAGFEIDYPLTSNISLATTCRYRKNITSTYQKSSPIIEKPAFIYPAIAIKYKF